ncbi:hypothetical protein [Nonomuraea sp. NPDC050691]|uniref:hypothetical protein n=1 Tax=Nonomuraea sp. NPDC050691 TaxID=3155661 RepID=UPI0033EB2511
MGHAHAVRRRGDVAGTPGPLPPGEPAGESTAAERVREKAAEWLAERCHPQTLRQVRWANVRLKESATQALVS